MNTILHYLQKNKSYHLLQQLIKSFYGFGLMLLTLEGQVIADPSLQRSSQSLDYTRQHSLCSGSRVLDHELLQNVRDSLQPKIIESNPGGHKQLLVPVVQKKDVIGFLLVREDEKVRLTEAESQITLEFLTDYVRLLVKTELEFVEYAQHQNMTHQQCLIHDVVKYVQENYYNFHLTLKAIAEWRGISYHHLSVLFKQEMGMNFKAYLNQVRLDKAIQLLKSRRLPISQVAYQCGFEDPAYFSKFFKQKIGISPADCREHPTAVRIKRKNILQYAFAS